MQKQSVYIAQN